jgi:hypothetical protein
MKKLGLILLMLMSFSCEKALMTPSPDTNPKAVFQQVWDFANEKYSFFEFKKVDWDKAYKTHIVNIKDTMTDEQLFKVCADLLYELKDEHVNLISQFDVSRNPEVFLDYPTNYFADVLNRNYFNGRKQIVDGSFGIFEFPNALYLRYASFSDNISDFALDYVIDKANSKKSLIIDLRDNGGGAVLNIDKLCSRFIDKKTVMGVEFHKSGPGKEDFLGQEISVDIEKDSKKFINKPIYILTNRGCYSATNKFVAYMKGLAKVTIIGGQTGGGGGLPTATEISNGWVLRVSGSQFFDRNKLNIENGIMPDIKVDILATDLVNGKDSILERALLESAK